MAETTSRVLALLNLLQTHRQWAGPELAQRLEVTERTLRRDVERLRELGYTIEATRGSSGGYRLEAGSQLPPLLLTDDEAVTMAIGLRLAATQGLIDGEQSSLSALAKFEQVLPAALRSRVNALGAHVQPNERRGVPVSQELLGQLALACRDNERIRFDYTAANGDASKRVVEPHAVVAAAKNWFLVCWDLQRADWRTFRVDRMSNFFGTHLHFAPRELPAADAAEFLRAAQHALQDASITAEFVLWMPLKDAEDYFGPWASGFYALDPQRTVWPVSGPTMEEVMSRVVWIPDGVRYELRADLELTQFASAMAERLSRAVPRP